MYHLRPLIALLFFSIVCSTSFAQVNADFSANATSGCGSLQVSFFDESSSTNGSIVSWFWDLGGVNSSLENPGRIFGTPGLYTICLTVTDAQGNSDTECKEGFIQVFNLPEPAFTADPTVGCSPLEVTFQDLSTSVDGNIVEWIWGVGGSNGVIIDDGTLPSITNTYILPDNFSVSLTVIDENNCTNTAATEDFITVYSAPSIEVSYSDSFICDPPLAVFFSNDNIEPNVNYFWDFGNGSPIFVGANPPATIFNEDGDYTITVIAEHQNTLCRDTVVFDGVINVGYPIDFSFSSEEGCLNSEITFYDESILVADSIVWDFGDGATSTLSNPTHIYTQSDCYTITLTRYVNGCESSVSSDNCIEINPLPSVSFNNDNAVGCTVPHNVNFFNAPINGIVSWFWDFGDGNTSTSPDTSNVYTSFGNYPVSLTVVDEFGCTNTFVDTIEIAELDALIDFNINQGCAPLSFDLQDNSTTLAPIVSWSWLIDTSYSDPNSPLLVSNLANPSFVIADTGIYSVQLIVTNALGCTDTVFYSEAIRVGMVPIVNFEAIPLNACAGDPIQFTDLSSSFVNEWLWEFGDSMFSTEQNPSYVFNNAGLFDVTLTAIHNGCFSTLEFEEYIALSLPVSGFSMIRDCESLYYVEFIDESVGADSVFWDFGLPGDMDTTSVWSPVLSFPDTGCYFVTQTVFNDSTGCMHERTEEICITAPIASFELDTLYGCSPLTINLINNSIFVDQVEWIAPGANISTVDSINYSLTFNNPGIYNSVELVVTDINGCRDTSIFVEDIMVNEVTTNFLFIPVGGCAPLEIQFVDNSTSLFGNIIDWAWQFGGVLYPLSTPNLIYEFDTTGNFDVGLTVTDDWGCSGSLTVPDAIHATTPIPLFSGDTVGCTNASAFFINESIGESLSYFWTFGDFGISTDENPTHQYVNEGVFEVCLTITDLYGCSKVYCQDIEISNPVANFELDATYSNCPPLLVNFQNLSLNASLFEWDFGDGSGISNQENPPHVYTAPGIYDVSLIASSTDNCFDTLLIEDLIVLEGPIGDFYFDIDTACVPATITFYGQSDDYYDYIWDFGNGELDTVFNVIADTTVHVFNEPGLFFPNLILVNSTICQRAIESPIPIVLEKLEIDFVVIDTLLCGHFTDVLFLNLTNSTVPIIGLEWYFEGGSPTISSEFEPMVNFDTVGLFDVTLMVDNGYCIDSITKQNYINNAVIPEAIFSQSEDTGCIPLGVQYTDQSTVEIGTITMWQWDLGDGDIADVSDPYHIYLDDGVMPVQLIITSDMGCKDSISNQVSIYSPPEVSLYFSDDEICIGDYIDLTAVIVDTAGVTYSWAPDNSLSCLDCLNPVANPTVSTTYSFISTNGDGCSDTSQIFIDVLPYEIPIVTINDDTTICLGESIQLTASGGDSASSYDWDENTAGLSCYENCQNPIATPSNTSTYFITVTNMYGCDAQDSIEISIIDQTQTFAGNDEFICEGDSVQLNLSINGDINWLVNNGLSCNDCSDPVAFPLTTTNYIVSLTTLDFACEIFDSVLVTVLTEDDIDAGDAIEICEGETTVLNGSGNGTVIWNPSNTLNNPNIINPEATPFESTTYFLSLEQGNCILEDSVYVSLVDQTIILLDDYVICYGDSIELEPIGVADTYFWTPVETLSDPTLENPLAFPLETTSYLLEASQTVCAPGTATSTVVVEPLPNVSLPPNIPFFEGIPIEIEATALDSRNYSYSWSPADSLSCSNCSNPIFTSSVSMSLEVLVIDMETGCEIILRTNMNLLKQCNPNLISVPNAFSPNHDGFNDELKLISNTITEINTFKIFNRWGALIFETNDFYEAWDGTFNGEDLPVGVYVYFVEADCDIDGTKFLKKGDITILK